MRADCKGQSDGDDCVCDRTHAPRSALDQLAPASAKAARCGHNRAGILRAPAQPVAEMSGGLQHRREPLISLADPPAAAPAAQCFALDCAPESSAGLPVSLNSLRAVSTQPLLQQSCWKTTGSTLRGVPRWQRRALSSSICQRWLHACGTVRVTRARVVIDEAARAARGESGPHTVYKIRLHYCNTMSG